MGMVRTLASDVILGLGLTLSTLRWLAASVSLPARDPVPTVSSIEELRTMRPPEDTAASSRVAVEGYFVPRDGGGGTFFWDDESSEADDGGMVIRPDAPTSGRGRWKREVRDVVTAIQFGAVSDGRTDSAEAIQRAVDYVAAHHSRLSLAGHFLIKKPIRLTGAAYDVCGCGGIIRRSGGSASSIFRIVNAQRLRVYDFELLEGEHSAAQPSTGSNAVIQIGDTDRSDDTLNQDIEIFNNAIRGSNWAGIMVYGNRGAFGVPKSRNIDIHHNRVTDSSNGIFIYKNAEQISVRSNRIALTAQDGIVFDTRAATDTRPTEANRNISILDNVVVNPGRYGQGIGIVLKGDNAHALIEGNDIRYVARGQARPSPAYGILINADFSGSAGHDYDVRRNTVDGVDPPGRQRAFGIYLGPSCESARILDNTIRNVGSYAVFVFKSTDVVIAGNSIADSGGKDYVIRIDGDGSGKSRHVTVERNRLARAAAVTKGALFVGEAEDVRVADNDLTGFAGDARSERPPPGRPAVEAPPPTSSTSVRDTVRPPAEPGRAAR